MFIHWSLFTRRPANPRKISISCRFTVRTTY
jgi:hypothetical protein